MLTERQQEIIDASLEIISGQGIQNLTIKNISKKIGISEPAIYRHYENKISILVSILNEFKSLSSNLFRDQNLDHDSAIQKIENIFKGLFDAFKKSPSLVSVIFSEEIFRNEPVLRERISEIMEHNSSVIQSLVINGQQSGEIIHEIDPEYLTLIITGSLRMLVRNWHAGANQLNQGEEVKNLFQAIRSLIEVK